MKRTVITAVLVAGSIGLAGCGSGTTPSTAGTASATSSAAPVAVRSGDPVDLAPIMRKSSAAVLAKKTAHLSMTVGSGAVQADVDYAGPSTAMKMSMDAGGQKVDLIVVDKVLYLGGTMAAQLGAGKTWLKIDPKGTDAISKQLAPLLGQMSTAAQDPTKALGAMSGVKATVASVDGGNTTYAVTLDKAQVEQMLKAGGADALGGATVPDGLSYKVTLDADSLPVRVVTSTGGVDATVSFTRWGQPVDISAPPASEVGSLKLPG